MPAIRAIVREAERNDYKMSSFILGVVKSPAFRMSKLDDDALTTTAGASAPGAAAAASRR
jgi:hypothetical protein